MKTIRKIGMALTIVLATCAFVACSGDDDDDFTNKVDKEETKDDGKEKDGKITVKVNGVSFKMVKVVGGTFQMGATEEHHGANEVPVHQVTLSDYCIGETEVTQELWQAVMGWNPSKDYWNDSEMYPVQSVSWYDCQTFITELNKLTGKQFRLPTEAEWEFAARGGNLSQGYTYSGSNDINAVAWYRDNSKDRPHEVGAKAPNELGIYDMTGNVNEWCQDWAGDYSSSPQTNPTGPSENQEDDYFYHDCKISRGGGFADYPIPCSGRCTTGIHICGASIGLRLAL